MTYQIYTMYVNRKDLLASAISSLGEYARSIVIIDNSLSQDLIAPNANWTTLKPDSPLFCSQAYNFILCDATKRKQDLFFIMHSDARATPEVIDALLAKAEELNADQRRWGVLFTNYDVLALHNTAMLKDFRWDPYLPLYYTDCDFYYRLKLAGIELIETNLPVEHCEGGSTTLKADLALQTFVNTNYAGWRNYYIQKWGGERGQETFTEPFNGDKL